MDTPFKEHFGWEISRTVSNRYPQHQFTAKKLFQLSHVEVFGAGISPEAAENLAAEALTVLIHARSLQHLPQPQPATHVENRRALDAAVEKSRGLERRERSQWLLDARKELLNSAPPTRDQAFMLLALCDYFEQESREHAHECRRVDGDRQECHAQIAEQQREIWRLREDLARALRESCKGTSDPTNVEATS